MHGQINVKKLYFASDAQNLPVLLRTFYIRVISDHYTDHLTLVLVTDIGGYFFRILPVITILRIRLI